MVKNVGEGFPLPRMFDLVIEREAKRLPYIFFNDSSFNFVV